MDQLACAARDAFACSAGIGRMVGLQDGPWTSSSGYGHLTRFVENSNHVTNTLQPARKIV